ncbi:hypothetical protein Q2T40_11910 [Winogradskyella maritima]|uniref:Cleaved adhesin domain-containing protein n=1 Tax=Winogradskyella maritima TaxID=1517766 RepID=A0ABV8ALJ1_9FLAO|nr:hypothetical protein [Winogradskyella maritima]
MRHFYLSLFSFFIFIIIAGKSNAQVGIGTTTPDNSAVLDIHSETQGLLTPRLTTLQRESILNPATGLLVFDTDFGVFFNFNGTEWVQLVATNDPDTKKSGWVAMTDADTEYTLNFVDSPDLTDYSNFTHIELDFSNDPSDSTIDSFAPTGTSASDFYDDVNHTLTPLAVGDAVLLRLNFDVVPANGNGFIAIAIDIGDTSEIIIYEKTIPLLRGSGRRSKVSESILLYQLGTFLANGAKIKLAYSRQSQNTGTTCVVNNFGLVVTKLSDN